MPQLYTLADAYSLPSLCGSRINYDRYSTDKTKFGLALLPRLAYLPCNHIYNQFYIFVDDAQKQFKMEGKGATAILINIQEKILLAGMQLMNFK